MATPPRADWSIQGPSQSPKEAPAPRRMRREAPKAQVRQPLIVPDKDLSTRKAAQSKPVERFNHRTFRTDWAQLVKDLFTRVVDGCPFAVGLFTRDDTWGVPRLRDMLNYNGGQEKMLYYVRRHFKRKHYDHIANSLEGLAPHELYDLYKIVSPGLGLPVNSLVCKIEHYSEPDLKCVIVFGGERLEGQMEIHLKILAAILEEAPKVRDLERNSAEEQRYAKLITKLRNTDPRKLRKLGLDRRRRADVHEIVAGLDGMQ